MSESTASAEVELAAEIATGLRSLAAMLEAHPDLAREIRHCAYYALLAIPLEDQHARLARWARAGKAVGAKVSKNADDKQFEVSVEFGPVRVRAIADRSEVCERVVVGTETVTKKIKDPQALAAVAEIEVTEEVETVEWVCRPLLADAAQSRETTAMAGAAS